MGIQILQVTKSFLEIRFSSTHAEHYGAQVPHIPPDMHYFEPTWAQNLFFWFLFSEWKQSPSLFIELWNTHNFSSAIKPEINNASLSPLTYTVMMLSSSASTLSPFSTDREGKLYSVTKSIKSFLQRGITVSLLHYLSMWQWEQELRQRQGLQNNILTTIRLDLSFLVSRKKEPQATLVGVDVTRGYASHPNPNSINQTQTHSFH